MPAATPPTATFGYCAEERPPRPGDEVDVELRDDEIVLIARRHPAQLGGRFARSGMAARLLEDRAREPR